jgi:hypothetical protein
MDDRASVRGPRRGALRNSRGRHLLRRATAIRGDLPEPEMPHRPGAVSELFTVRRPHRPINGLVGTKGHSLHFNRRDGILIFLPKPFWNFSKRHCPQVYPCFHSDVESPSRTLT